MRRVTFASNTIFEGKFQRKVKLTYQRLLSQPKMRNASVGALLAVKEVFLKDKTMCFGKAAKFDHRVTVAALESIICAKMNNVFPVPVTLASSTTVMGGVQ